MIMDTTMTTPIKSTTPLPVLRLLGKLGSDIRDARLRRRIRTVTLAERALISRTTLHRIERGDPGDSMGNYATVLFVWACTTGFRRSPTAPAMCWVSTSWRNGCPGACGFRGVGGGLAPVRVSGGPPVQHCARGVAPKVHFPAVPEEAGLRVHIRVPCPMVIRHPVAQRGVAFRISVASIKAS